MPINTDFLVRRIDKLELALKQLQRLKPDDDLYETVRTASVKDFEVVLEQSGKLLKKRLMPYFAGNRQADELNFRDIFRHAAKHGLISVESCERWLAYRDNRNDTTHEYGEEFAEATLKLLPGFITDARGLARVIAEGKDD